MGHRFFLDTNCILDILLERNPDSKFLQGFLREVDPDNVFISAITVTNVFYIAKVKNKNRYFDFIKHFNTVDLTSEILTTAFKLDLADLEDAVQIASAFEADCNFLISNDLKDKGKLSKFIDVITPAQLSGKPQDTK